MQFEPEPEDEWQAHCRNVVAMVEGETAPEEPVMAGEVVRVEAEAESEAVSASEVVPEVVEGEEGVATEPVVASETIERDAPAKGAAEEPRGWLSSLLGARREGGAEADAEARKSEIDQAAGKAVPEAMEREAPAEGSTRGSVEATGKGKNRPQSPAPADLFGAGLRVFGGGAGAASSLDEDSAARRYTGSDGLVSTDDISGNYSTSCFGWLCTSMTVEPLGADLIEVRKSHWFCLPLCIGPSVDGDVWIRDPNTNAFRRLEDRNLENQDPHNISGATFSADGTAAARLCFQDVSYQKKAVSQKRTFQKVDTGDLAGTWCSCIYTPCVPLWFLLGCLCTTKKALNEDQYEESGCGCHLFPPFIALPRRDDPGRAGPSTRTRFYANGHPTNGFYDGINISSAHQNFIRWYSDASCGYGGLGVFSKKLW